MALVACCQHPLEEMTDLFHHQSFLLEHHSSRHENSSLNGAGAYYGKIKALGTTCQIWTKLASFTAVSEAQACQLPIPLAQSQKGEGYDPMTSKPFGKWLLMD